MEERVIIVGGGLAGMAAALAAAQTGIAVTMIDRGSIGLGTNSALANGVFAGPTHRYGKEEYIADTMDIGRHINRQSSVKQIALESPGAFTFLEDLGITMIESANLRRADAARPGIIPGMTLVKRFAEALAHTPGIEMVTGFYITDLLLRDHGIRGVKGFDRRGGEKVYSSPAVVLATGGAGAVYLRNDNQRHIMGQGFYLAARAGLPLWDMEFVQFYPLVISDPHLPSMLLYPPHPHEATLINELGEDVLKRYGLGSINEAIMKKRDQFSVLLHNESQKGRIFMDFRNVDDSAWKVHPLSILGKLRFNAREHPVPVSPAAHFCMGGVETDSNGETGLAGLFACGELVWGLHGANRRGGNALLECVVTGQIAGRNSAALVKSVSFSRRQGRSSRDTGDRQATGGTASLRDLRNTLRSTAWEYGGIVRDKAGIQKGLEKLTTLEAALHAVDVGDVRDRTLRQDLVSGAFTLRAVLTASLGRKESRGAFIRSDFPDEDNRGWKKNSCLQYDPASGGFSLTYIDVG